MRQHTFKIGLPLLAVMVFLIIGVANGADKSTSTSPATPQASITIEKAITIAKAAMLGRVVEAELEEEDGTSVYEVEIVAIGGKTYEIKAGGGRQTVVQPRSPIARARLRTGLTQAHFAALLGVSRRTLEQWEQGRREPSGAAKTLIRVAELHPEILREIAA